MLNHRTRRLAVRDAHAVKRLAEIGASVAALGDDDLLDLADIFKSKPGSPLHDIARTEMAKRGIGL